MLEANYELSQSDGTQEPTRLPAPNKQDFVSFTKQLEESKDITNPLASLYLCLVVIQLRRDQGRYGQTCKSVVHSKHKVTQDILAGCIRPAIGEL